MRIIARCGTSYAVQVGERPQDPSDADTWRMRVLDLDRGILFPERSAASFLSKVQGYEPYEASDDELAGLLGQVEDCPTYDDVKRARSTS